MDDSELVTAADIRLMQGLAQRVTAVGPELVNADATCGELAWNWGKGHARYGDGWPRRLWFAADELVAWGWAQLPHRVRRNDGSVRDVTGANLVYQVHPAHRALVDEVIDWYDAVAAGAERTVVASLADEFALERWAAHGYETDPASLGDKGFWTQLNLRELGDDYSRSHNHSHNHNKAHDLGGGSDPHNPAGQGELERPVLPHGFRFRTAEEVGPRAVVQAHVDAWAPSSYSAESYEGVRTTSPYRADLHVLVEAPGGTMATSTIMWLDEVNRTAQFEPVGTHPDYRRLGLARAMLLHGMHLARAAGARRMTVVCLGAPGHPAARGLYYSVGFREISRDAALIKAAGVGS
ncbi:GNAT family N-acetyltransferase [Streptomyces sp. NA04227]|uniref:GNAT family N-acetyltransferase n=1 Tax=Streptomyces sp. NA04227 TaxID=2742136 RepID=UPI0015928F0D|nr:GNAT family N-acetyltransferase [Streptomyces sp. NA04227]QKW07036.1 GNAT family N-acetyltransferase [Streptomyces sp. NA04227]